MSILLSSAGNSAMCKFLLLSVLTMAGAQAANAHGVAGNREFPATLAVEDPSVADELTLPQINRFSEGDEGWGTESEIEYSKRLTDDFALSIGGAYVDGKEASGWDNIELGAKYQLFKSDDHEALVSVGLGWDIGGSGADAIGENFSTLTPTIYFGKGFGDVGGDFSLVKPFALTGSVGVAFPTDRHSSEEEINPDVLQWGWTVQYSLPYLQQHVKDVGLPQPLSQVVPVIEFAFETPLNGDSNKTTGTINPGFIWSNETMQIGAEAILPLNDESGDGVGARVQLHFFLDDLLPGNLGKPVFE